MSNPLSNMAAWGATCAIRMHTTYDATALAAYLTECFAWSAHNAPLVEAEARIDAVIPLLWAATAHLDIGVGELDYVGTALAETRDNLKLRVKRTHNLDAKILLSRGLRAVADALIALDWDEEG